MNYNINELALVGPEGTDILYRFFKSTSAEKILIFIPAMGVPAGYYKLFAEQLSEVGYHVAIIELRGHGKSQYRVSHVNDFGYDNIIQQDIHTIIQHIKGRFPSLPLILGGHSLGAQLSLLYASRYTKEIDQLLVIACASPLAKNFTGKQRASVFLAPYLFSVTSKLLGYHPGKTLGFGATESRTLINDWSYLAKTGKFAQGDDDFDYEGALRLVNLKVNVFSFQTDSFAPQKAILSINEKLISATLTHHIFRDETLSFKANHLKLEIFDFITIENRVSKLSFSLF